MAVLCPPWKTGTNPELAHSTQVLNDVDRALERLSEGTYGTCERCGDPIAEADLAVDPTRRVCPQHLVGSVRRLRGSQPAMVSLGRRRTGRPRRPS